MNELLEKLTPTDTNFPHYSPIKILDALRAVVEWTNNLQDTESWQDDAEYNAGYNNAIYEVIEIIKKELK